MSKNYWIFIYIIFMLWGCGSQPFEPSVQGPDLKKEMEEAIASQDQKTPPAPLKVPQSLNDDLLALPEINNQLRFDIHADQVNAQQFFLDLIEATGENIVIESGVAGSISLHLNDVTLSDVLYAIRDIYHFDYVKTGYGYRIMPDRLINKMFHINYLNVVRNGTSDTGITGSQITAEGGRASQVSTTTESDFWQELRSTLSMLLEEKPGRSVRVNSQAGIVIARANPAELRAIENYLQVSELIMQQQVIIEAKILEVTLSDGFQSGINWTSLMQDFSDDPAEFLTSSLNGENLQGNPDTGGVFNISLGLNNFTGVIELLSSQGDIQVLSSPRISTVNNQKAVIKVGNDDYYVTQVTQVEDDDGNTTPEVELTPFFSGIALDVTPQISQDNEIILHVRPSVTEVEEVTKVINLGTDIFQLPLASSSIRETDSIIRATSGQIVVIGGLLQNSEVKSSSGVPILSSIPLVKNLFAQNRRSTRKSELVILLQPTITNADVWKEELGAYESLLNQN